MISVLQSIDLERFWVQVALHLWQSTIVLALLVLLTLGMRRAPARYTHALLMMALIKFAIPLAAFGPLLQKLLGSLGAVTIPPTRVPLTEYVFVVLQPTALSVPPSGVANTTPLVYTFLTAGWIVGMTLLIARSCVRARRHHASCHGPTLNAIGHGGAELCQRVDAALDGTGIERSTIRVVASRTVPAVRGLFRRTILLPEDVVTELSPDELRAVALHENSHRKRHDTLRAALQQALLTVFFYYPPIWWLVQRLRATTENVCDEAVLASGVDPRTYARALARVVATRLDSLSPVRATDACLGRPGGLSARLKRIEDVRRYRVMKRHRWLVFSAGVLMLGSYAAPALIAAQPAPVRGGASIAKLDTLVGVDSPVTVRLENVSLEFVFRALDASTSTRFDVKGDLAETVSVDFTAAPLRGVLRQLATDHRVELTVRDPWTIEVQRGTRAVGPDPGQEIRIAGVGDVMNPTLITDSRVQPVYPADAREDRAKGNVIFQAVIHRDGSVGELEVLRQSNEDYAFAESAEAAIRQWRYEPATLHGEPVDVYFTIFVEFKLQ